MSQRFQCGVERCGCPGGVGHRFLSDMDPMGAGVGDIIMPTSCPEILMLKGGAQEVREGRDSAHSK